MADDNTKLIIVLEAQSKKLQSSLVQVNRQIDRFAQQTERRFEQMQKRNAASFEKLGASVRNSLGGLQNLLGPVVGAIGIREVIHYADAWQEAQNKIAAASQVAGIQARALEDIKDAANGARTDLESYVDLYSRLLRVAPGVAATELEIARATDIVAKSLKAGGASMQEQQASLIQLGQAIGSGFLQGDELRSLRENAPLIAQAIANEFGVTIGELKKLGAEGKLTSDRVFRAILGGGQEIEAAFKATQSTIKDAFTRIGNEFTAYIGTAGRASGATQGLIDALNYLADNFKEIAPLAANFAALLAGAFAGKIVVTGLGQMIVALGALITAIRTGTLAAGGLTAALGPVGLLAGAVAASIYLLYQYQEDAKRAAEEHAKALKENADKLDLAKTSSQEFRNALRSQIQLQTSAASAALAEARAQLVANAARAQLAQQLSGVPLIGGVAIGASTAFQQMIAADLAKIADAQKTLDALRLQLADVDNTMTLPPGDDDRAGGGASGGGTETKKKGDSQWQNAIDAVTKRTAALQAQTAAQATLNPLVNDYGFAMERAKTKSDLLQAAMDAELEITPELEAAIDSLATGYATASAEAAKLSEAQGKALEAARDWFDLGRDATRGFINDLIEGKTAAEALGGALNKLADKLMNMGLDALFGGGGQDFGLIGKALGFAGGGVYAHGRSQSLRKFASGGVSRTAAIFGEAGPEAAVPLPDGRRIPVDLRMPTAAAGGGVTVHFAPVVDARGADPAAIARLSGELAKMKAELPATVVGAVRKARATRNL